MQRRSGRVWTALAPVFAAMILASCAKDLGTGPRLATLVGVSGDGQSGAIGATLQQPLVIKVLDQSGIPVVGETIVWQVTAGGGSVLPSQSTTDANGIASTTLRLGTTIGTNRVLATLGDLDPVVFTASATAAPPTKLLQVGGDGQIASVGTQLPVDLSVQVTDAVGNPKPGVLITFAVTSGGGTLSAASALSDATGTASVHWTLGALAGTQTATASVSGLTSVIFTATGRASIPDALTILSGNNQSGSPGAPLPDSLRVKLTDRFGNPVSGVAITFSANPGAGTVNPTVVTTDANGRAATRWTLGSTGGPQSVTVTGGGFTQTFIGGANVRYTSISAGGRSTCGISTDNVMLCWGYNGEGQLGIGQGAVGSGPVFAFPQPTGATGNLTFRQIVAALYHTCAVTFSSVAYCWGVNFDGRLGDNSLVASVEPKQLVTAVSFRQMAVSRNHTCGLSLSDRVYCWGYAGDGQIGDGIMGPPISPRDSVLVPTEVAGDATLRYMAISAGGQHTCALTNGSAAYCWGFNSTGQLGNGGTSRDSVPTAVSGGLSFSAISAGYTHTCAVSLAGAGYCWGGNASGQLGTGAAGNTSTPAPVSGGLVFVAISAGEAHSCGLTSAGAVYCWGSNAFGQLGTGNQNNQTTPAAVAGGLVFSSVSAGDQHTCAVTTDHIVYCWGDNQYGQLGTGTASAIAVTTPAKVAFQP